MKSYGTQLLLLINEIKKYAENRIINKHINTILNNLDFCEYINKTIEEAKLTTEK